MHRDLCRYLAAKSEADHYVRELRREEEEIVAVPDTGPNFFCFIFFYKLTFFPPLKCS
jgi:hypothetical protein